MALSFELVSHPPLVTHAETPAGISTGFSPAAEPGFIKVSPALREAIGSIDRVPAAESISLLRTVRKNMMAPPHEKQLAAYVLAALLKGSPVPTDKQEAFKLFNEAAGFEPLSTPGHLRASEIAAGLNDEKAVQDSLLPLLKKAEALARASEPSKSKTKKTASLLDLESRDPVLPEAIYRLGESYFKCGDTGAATNVFERIREIFPKTEFAIGACYYLGTIALDSEADVDTGLREYRDYLRRCPQGRNAPKIANRLLSMSEPKLSVGTATPGAPVATTGGSETESSTNTAGGGADDSGRAPASLPQIKLAPADYDLIATAFYKHGQYGEALKYWDRIGSGNIYRAVCLSKIGKRQEAAATLLNAARQDPKNPLVPDVASALCKPLTGKDAGALWQEILKLNIARTDEALWNVAKRLGYPEGTQYYYRLVANHPTSEYAPESAWWLVWHGAHEGYGLAGEARKAKFTKVLELCDKSLSVYGHTHVAPKFAFWKGKFHELLGQKQQAIAAYQQASHSYPGSYYGFRSQYRSIHLQSAAQAAAAKPGTPAPPVIPDRKWSTIANRRSPNPNWTWPEPPQVFRWQSLPGQTGDTSATLAWLKQYDEALRFSTGTMMPETKAWLQLKAGKIMPGVGTAGYRLEGFPEQNARWEMAYPLAYADIVETEAKKRGVDPLLVHGLIRQESRYDPQALSRSNAMGLMQLLKGTAYGVAKHNGIALNSPQEIFSPRINIALGTAYIAYVLKRNEGNAMYAVGSYNGGPNAVAKWIKQHEAKGQTDQDVYVEDIPYDETRDYVRKVYSHYWNYELLYARKE